MKLLKIAPVAVIAVSLAACQGTGPKEGVGTLVGAGLGGAIGSQIGSGSGRGVAIVAGIIIGGLIGNQIGRAMDEQDRAYAQQTAQQSLQYSPSGTTSSWQNQQSGNSGQFTPTTGTYTGPNGRPCRDFSNTVVMKDGRQQTVQGTACMNPDGSWETTG